MTVFVAVEAIVPNTRSPVPVMVSAAITVAVAEIEPPVCATRGAVTRVEASSIAESARGARAIVGVESETAVRRALTAAQRSEIGNG